MKSVFSYGVENWEIIMDTYKVIIRFDLCFGFDEYIYKELIGELINLKSNLQDRKITLEYITPFGVREKDTAYAVTRAMDKIRELLLEPLPE